MCMCLASTGNTTKTMGTLIRPLQCYTVKYDRCSSRQQCMGEYYSMLVAIMPMPWKGWRVKPHGTPSVASVHFSNIYLATIGLPLQTLCYTNQCTKNFKWNKPVIFVKPGIILSTRYQDWFNNRESQYKILWCTKFQLSCVTKRLWWDLHKEMSLVNLICRTKFNYFLTCQL